MSRYVDDDEVVTTANGIKLAMWFLDKVGSPMVARAYLDAAIHAVEAAKKVLIEADKAKAIEVAQKALSAAEEGDKDEH